MNARKLLITGMMAAALALATGNGARADGGIMIGTIIGGVAGLAALHHLNRLHTAYPSTPYVQCYPGTYDCIRQRACHYGEIGEYHCHFY